MEIVGAGVVGLVVGAGETVGDAFKMVTTKTKVQNFS